jgi:hypothetical protein
MTLDERIHYFGRLELVETYDFYDRPVLATWRNAVGVFYLCVLIEETHTTETWLYVAMTEDRFRYVRSGSVDLYTAFREPEDGVAFRVVVPTSQSASISLEAVGTNDIPAGQLPAPGERLRLPTETLPRFIDSLSLEASRTHRDLLKLSFELPSIYRTEVPARFLGQVLTTTQNAVTSIAQALGETGRQGAFLRQASELEFVAAGSGSFEIKLASFEIADLFGKTTASNAMSEFVKLMRLGSEAELLQARLTELKARAATSYLAFLQALDKTVNSARAEWASPAREAAVTASLSALTLRAAIAILEFETFESSEDDKVEGRLTGASLTKKTFEISTGTRRVDRIAGKIDDAAMSSVRGAVINGTYRAFIRRSQRRKVASSEVVEEIILLGLTPLDSGIANFGRSVAP